MRARIYCPVGELKVDRTFGAEAVLGRSPLSTIELTPRLLSAQHARIAWDEGRGCYLLEDLGSSNGTRLDGEPVREPRPLGHLHVITLAESYDLVFQDLDRCAARHAKPERQRGSTSVSRTNIEILNMPLPSLLRPTATPVREKTLFQRLNLPVPDLLRSRRPDDAKPEPPPASAQVPATHQVAEPEPAQAADGDTRPDTASAEVRPARWWIELSEPAPGPHRVLLREGDNQVGRSSEADVVIASPEVSRRHACLSVRGGRLYVRDLGSSNRTLIDDEPVETELELSPGQKLCFGAIEARVVVGRATADGQLLAEGDIR